MPDWFVKSELRQWFPDLDTTIGQQGEQINSNWMSRLVMTAKGEDRFFVKTYSVRGRGLRRYLGRSRARAEWENLRAFVAMGVPSAELVAFGESSAGGYRGVIVTREVGGTADLSTLVEQAHPLLRDWEWRDRLIRRLSEAVRSMHSHGFVHNDLKWRNILVRLDDPPLVYLIDCPLGRRMPAPFLARGRIKDLACLDKVAKVQLSKSERLRFYLAYKGRDRMNVRDKQEIGRVLKFFEGRE